MKVAKQKRTGGFTLIELIVVIAILGILAGVGTVAYTGYVKRANKGVDQQMVTDVVNSIYYAWMANPNGMDSVGAVVLSKDDVPKYSNGDTSTIKSAVQMAFGDESQLRLKYDWGNNSAVLQNVAEYAGALKDQLEEVTTGNPNVTNISFVNESDLILNDMFSALTSEKAKDLLADVNISDASAANVLNNAAKYTLATENSTDYALFTDSKTLAEAWSTLDWTDTYRPAEDASEKAYFEVAGAGMSTARNYALALYMQNHISELVAEGETTEAVQATVATLLNNKVNDVIGDRENTVMDTVQAPQTFVNAVNSYFGATVVRYSNGKIENTGTASSQTSQAYADGLGYAAAMTTINKLEQQTQDMDDNSYFNTITGGVNTAVAIMNNTIDPEQLSKLTSMAVGTNNNVVITVINQGGKLDVTVSPADAYLGSVGDVQYDSKGNAVIPEAPVQTSFNIIVTSNGNKVYLEGSTDPITSLAVPANSTINIYMAAGANSLGNKVVFGNTLSNGTAIQNPILKKDGEQINTTSIIISSGCTLSGTWSTVGSNGSTTNRTWDGFNITLLSE